MRNRLNLIIRDIYIVRSLNHTLNTVKRTKDLNIEAKFEGKLFECVDQCEKTWRRRIGVKSDQGIE